MASSTYCDFATVNVFTTLPFSGNPLAIVELPREDIHVLTKKQKLLIAREFNLSETVFVHQSPVDSTDRSIEIFTPTTELPFAGHPVIGVASWIISKLENTNAVTLHSEAGRIPVSVATDSEQPASEIKAEVPSNVRLHQKRFPLSELLRLHGSLSGRLRDVQDFPVFSIVNGMTQVHVELPSLEVLECIKPALGGEWIPGDEKYLDEGWASHHLLFYFFVRNVDDEALGRKVVRSRAITGQLEDPATGSAASGLGAYLSLQSGTPGIHEFHIVQGVELGRRSDIRVRVALGEDLRPIHVDLSGSAVEVMTGRIAIPLKSG